MKKTVYFSITAVCALLLSGCTVNWFDKTYDVPWYVVAVPIILLCIIAHVTVMSGTYVCPKCGEEFKPKWYQISAYMHMGRSRLVKCPKCGRRDFCKRIK